MVNMVEGQTDLMGGGVSLVRGFAGCAKTVKTLPRLSHGMMGCHSRYPPPAWPDGAAPEAGGAAEYACWE